MRYAETERMFNAVVNWIAKLEAIPEWKVWTREKISRTIYFDDPYMNYNINKNNDFHHPYVSDSQHDVVYLFLGLQQTIISLKDCEYYFRRYPFHSLPVSHSDHITNICEMYFSRFYEFRERMKMYFEALKTAAPKTRFEFGKFIKSFDKTFDQEIRERHGIHHRGRFGDTAISRIYIRGILADKNGDETAKRLHNQEYRRVTTEWAKRVRLRSAKLDEFLEEIARTTLLHCPFLEPGTPEVRQHP